MSTPNDQLRPTRTAPPINNSSSKQSPLLPKSSNSSGATDITKSITATSNNMTDQPKSRNPPGDDDNTTNLNQFVQSPPRGTSSTSPWTASTLPGRHVPTPGQTNVNIPNEPTTTTITTTSSPRPRASHGLTSDSSTPATWTPTHGHPTLPLKSALGRRASLSATGSTSSVTFKQPIPPVPRIPQNVRTALLSATGAGTAGTAGSGSSISRAKMYMASLQNADNTAGHHGSSVHFADDARHDGEIEREYSSGDYACDNDDGNIVGRAGKRGTGKKVGRLEKLQKLEKERQWVGGSGDVNLQGRRKTNDDYNDTVDTGHREQDHDISSIPDFVVGVTAATPTPSTISGGTSAAGDFQESNPDDDTNTNLPGTRSHVHVAIDTPATSATEGGTSKFSFDTTENGADGTGTTRASYNPFSYAQEVPMHPAVTARRKLSVSSIHSYKPPSRTPVRSLSVSHPVRQSSMKGSFQSVSQIPNPMKLAVKIRDRSRDGSPVSERKVATDDENEMNPVASDMDGEENETGPLIKRRGKGGKEGFKEESDDEQDDFSGSDSDDDEGEESDDADKAATQSKQISVASDNTSSLIISFDRHFKQSLTSLKGATTKIIKAVANEEEDDIEKPLQLSAEDILKKKIDIDKISNASSKNKNNRSSSTLTSSTSSMGYSKWPHARELGETFTRKSYQILPIFFTFLFNIGILGLTYALSKTTRVNLPPDFVSRAAAVTIESFLLLSNFATIYAMDFAASIYLGSLLTAKYGYSMVSCGFIQTSPIMRVSFTNQLSLNSLCRKTLERVAYFWVVTEIVKGLTVIAATAMQISLVRDVGSPVNCILFDTSKLSDRTYPTFVSSAGAAELIWGTALGCQRSEGNDCGVDGSRFVFGPQMQGAVNDGDTIIGNGFSVTITTSCDCIDIETPSSVAMGYLTLADQSHLLKSLHGVTIPFVYLSENLNVTDSSTISDEVEDEISYNIFLGNSNTCGGFSASVMTVCTTRMWGFQDVLVSSSFITDGTPASIALASTNSLGNLSTTTINSTSIAHAYTSIINPSSIYPIRATIPGMLGSLLWWTSNDLVSVNPSLIESGMESFSSVILRAGIQPSTWYFQKCPIGPAIRAVRDPTYFMNLLADSPFNQYLQGTGNAPKHVIWQALDIFVRIGESVDTLGEAVGRIKMERYKLVRRLNNGRMYA
ncbi:hypothetical protein HDU76_012614 [Blyttiomyces sp. JEL0837]|nr:hypothetical protein HDU76_012614 [Blyttiomyces sp. JEL0837]